MKIIKLLLIATLLIGCDFHESVEEVKPIKKPFVIIHKFPKSAQCNKGYCSYVYLDANGNEVDFCENETKYFIGDTIK